MQLPVPMANLIDHAKRTSTLGGNVMWAIEATIITPLKQIPMVLPTGLARDSFFAIKHADDYQIEGSIQPGLYQQEVLPYKDDLYLELILRAGVQQTAYKFRAVPLDVNNPSIESNHSELLNLRGLDVNNIVTIKMQLMECNYDVLKTLPYSNTFLMCTTRDALHHIFNEANVGTSFSQINAERYYGPDIEEPTDNPKVYKQIIVPQGLRLIDVPNFLQYDDHYGIYSKGIGSFYRKGYYYFFPLFQMGGYNKASKVLDIYRIPPDIAPTLEQTYFYNTKTVSIISTGNSTYQDHTDIDKQNDGVGKRVVSGDAVMGETGYYYGKGEAVTTRPDSVSEYKTSERKSGNEYIPFADKPTGNVFASLSINARNDGELITIPWDNSNSDMIIPGMCCKIYYLEGKDSVKFREGKVLGVRTEYRKNKESTHKVFREYSVLTLFLSKVEQ